MRIKMLWGHFLNFLQPKGLKYWIRTFYWGLVIIYSRRNLDTRHRRIWKTNWELEISNGAFVEAWSIIVVLTVMLAVALLVVLPAVLVALLMSGNTWKLNSSQLSPTTNNFLASVSHFFFLFQSIYHCKHQICISWKGSTGIQRSRRALLSLKFILASSWSNCCLWCVECCNQSASWQFSSCTPNKPNDTQTQITFKFTGSQF